MKREDIKKVLNCPFKDLMLLALELVNLKDKERLAVEYVDIKGNTEETTAEIMKCSVRSIRNYRKQSYIKMGKVWENQDLIKKILEL